MLWHPERFCIKMTLVIAIYIIYIQHMTIILLILLYWILFSVIAGIFTFIGGTILGATLISVGLYKYFPKIKKRIKLNIPERSTAFIWCCVWGKKFCREYIIQTNRTAEQCSIWMQSLLIVCYSDICTWTLLYIQVCNYLCYLQHYESNFQDNMLLYMYALWVHFCVHEVYLRAIFSQYKCNNY